MGNCNKIQAPIIANRCSNYGDRMGSSPSISGGMILEHFCSLAGVGGNGNRKKWCSRVGANEWEWRSNSGNNSCHYNDCHPYQTQPTGCCGGCCGIIGKGVTCDRKAGSKGFTGSPLPCCLQDYSGCNVFDAKLGPSLTQPPPNPGVYSVDQMNLCFSDVKTDNTYPAPINNGRENKNCYPVGGDSKTQDNCLNTCAPCVRDITSNDKTQVSNVENNKVVTTTCGKLKQTTCQDVIMEYCTGADLPKGDTSWLYRWMYADGSYIPNGCIKVIPRNLYTYPNDDGVLAPTKRTCDLTKIFFETISRSNDCTPMTFSQSADGFAYVKKLLEATLERYTEDGFVIGSMPGTPGYNPFQDLIHDNICCRFPNLCASSLSTSCANYSAQQLSYNIPASNMCGCYLPNNEYQKYVNEFQVNIECTPLCNRPGVIPLSNPDGSAVRCRQDVCIIDDIALNLTTTNITGDINITQMCANCSDNSSYDSRASASCNCTINANTINVTGNEISNVNINNTCTSTSCTLTNPNTGLNDIIPCSQIPNQREYYDQQYAAQQALIAKERNRRNFIILGVIAATAIIIIILYFLINMTGKKTKANAKDDKTSKTAKGTKDVKVGKANHPKEPSPYYGGYMEGSMSLAGFSPDTFRGIS